MEELERRRGAAARAGIIIPIWYRGDTEVGAFAGLRPPLDFRRVVLPSQLARSIPINRMLQQACGRIDGLVRAITDAGVDCQSWQISVGPDTTVPRVTDPSAVRHANI
jgi:hypothetical protein